MVFMAKYLIKLLWYPKLQRIFTPIPFITAILILIPIQTIFLWGIVSKPIPSFPGYFAGELVDQAILSIPLSIPNFALPIMSESGNTTLDGNDGTDEFLSYFKGIKISTTTGVDGGLYYVDMLNPFTRIRLFYRDTSGTSANHDTLDFDFNINSNCAFFTMLTTYIAAL